VDETGRTGRGKKRAQAKRLFYKVFNASENPSGTESSGRELGNRIKPSSERWATEGVAIIQKRRDRQRETARRSAKATAAR